MHPCTYVSMAQLFYRPSQAAQVPRMSELLALLDQLLLHYEHGGRAVYVHCWGGRGRAGLVGAYICYSCPCPHLPAPPTSMNQTFRCMLAPLLRPLPKTFSLVHSHATYGRHEAYAKVDMSVCTQVGACLLSLLRPDLDASAVLQAS